MLTKADEGGKGVSQMLIIVDEGGRGVSRKLTNADEPPILADVICEQPLRLSYICQTWKKQN